MLSVAQDDQESVTRKSAVVYGAILSLAFSVVGFLVIGWLLDRWLGTSPWLVVTGIVVGAGVGFYQFIRLLSRIS